MKKLFLLLFVLVMLLTVTACGDEKESSNDNTETTIDDASASMVESLTTQYEIEDYLDNAIIVSKNDGLLYGLIDNKGNEIIPVKYDDMEFFNRYDYIDGYYDNYIWCKYEGTEYIFDSKGKEITRSEKQISNAFSVSNGEKAPYFEIDNKLYDQNMNFIAAAPVINTASEEILVSENCYVCISYEYDSPTNPTIKRYVGTFIYDYNGNVIKKYDEPYYNFGRDYYFEYDNQLVMVFENDDTEKIVHIDEKGNVVEEKSNMIPGEIMDKYGEEKGKYNFYKSNSTYKMEDLNGKPLYAERYYKALEVEGKNDCRFLTDEDDNVCIFGNQGYLYAKFGTFINKDDKLYLQLQDGDEYIEKVFEGKNSIAVLFKNTQGTQIKFYYYQ